MLDKNTGASATLLIPLASVHIKSGIHSSLKHFIDPPSIWLQINFSFIFYASSYICVCYIFKFSRHYRPCQGLCTEKQMDKQNCSCFIEEKYSPAEKENHLFLDKRREINKSEVFLFSIFSVYHSLPFECYKRLAATLTLCLSAPWSLSLLLLLFLLFRLFCS